MGKYKEFFNPKQSQKIYAKKLQFLTAPNWLVVKVFGPVERKQDDSCMLVGSGVLEQSEQNTRAAEVSTLYTEP